MAAFQEPPEASNATARDAGDGRIEPPSLKNLCPPGKRSNEDAKVNDGPMLCPRFYKLLSFSAAIYPAPEADRQERLRPIAPSPLLRRTASQTNQNISGFRITTA